MGGIWVRLAPGRLNNPKQNAARYQYVLMQVTLSPNVSAVKVRYDKCGLRTLVRERTGTPDTEALMPA